MRQAQQIIAVSTRGQGLVDVTDEVADFVAGEAMQTGLLTIFCRHTSASLLIQENADPAVQVDLERFFARLVPESDPLYTHTTEGPDDMPAHVKSALTQVQLSIPVARSRRLLGTWQGIYLFEHRRAAHRRELVLHLIGD